MPQSQIGPPNLNESMKTGNENARNWFDLNVTPIRLFEMAVCILPNRKILLTRLFGLFAY